MDYLPALKSVCGFPVMNYVLKMVFLIENYELNISFNMAETALFDAVSGSWLTASTFNRVVIR
jgi:hypothetical protein